MAYTGEDLGGNRRKLPRQITRAIVMIASRKAVEIQNAKGYVPGPKRNGTFGARLSMPCISKAGDNHTKPLIRAGRFAELERCCRKRYISSETNPEIESLTLSENYNGF